MREGGRDTKYRCTMLVIVPVFNCSGQDVLNIRTSNRGVTKGVLQRGGQEQGWNPANKLRVNKKC